MTNSIEIIHVEPGSELAGVIDEARDRTLILEKDGVHYRLDRLALNRDILAGAIYDPDLALAGMRAAAGSWSDIDGEQLKEYIYRARELGSRPFDRP
jgi:hypothetical protein